MGHPVLALLFLVPLQEGAGELAQAEATPGGQLTHGLPHGLPHGQVVATEALADLTTTVGACGLLLLQKEKNKNIYCIIPST